MSQYYKKYMKKREEEKPGYFKLFIFAFLLMIVFFIIVAMHLASSVDISIGENDEGDIKESGLGVKHLIDSRLRFIQMEDVSSPAPKKETTETIQQYSKDIESVKTEAYNGKYQNSYGYETTQQTKPYSQTYANAQKQYNEAVKAPAQQQKTYSVPVPSTKHSAPSVNYTSPSHNIQKNLTPTGMN
ncbi:hypothetical protein J6O48_00195 [bacterium]|nr:hypothetical protein [bacterium]